MESVAALLLLVRCRRLTLFAAFGIVANAGTRMRFTVPYVVFDPVEFISDVRVSTSK